MRMYSVLGVTRYTAARMLALGTLIVAALERWKWSVAALAPPLGWVTVECGLLAVARVRDGSWHFYTRAADIAAVRVVQHLTILYYCYVRACVAYAWACRGSASVRDQ